MPRFNLQDDDSSSATHRDYVVSSTRFRLNDSDEDSFPRELIPRLHSSKPRKGNRPDPAVDRLTQLLQAACMVDGDVSDLLTADTRQPPLLLLSYQPTRLVSVPHQPPQAVEEMRLLRERVRLENETFEANLRLLIEATERQAAAEAEAIRKQQQLQQQEQEQEEKNMEQKEQERQRCAAAAEQKKQKQKQQALNDEAKNDKEAAKAAAAFAAITPPRDGSLLDPFGSDDDIDSTVSGKLSSVVVAPAAAVPQNIPEVILKAKTLVQQLEQDQATAHTFELSQDAVDKKRRLQFKKLANGKLNTLAENVVKIQSVAAEVVAAFRQAENDDRINNSQGKHYLLHLIATNVMTRVQADGFNGTRGDGFPLAAMLAMIANEYASFSNIFMAHVYSACPVAIPEFPTSTDLSDESFMTALGMKKAADGEFESFAKFISRTEGIMSLMGDIIASHPSTHTLFGGNVGGLLWLGHFIDLLPESTPLPILTAPVLDSFLTATGHMFANHHADAFRELLQRVYALVPRLDETELGAPSATRLKKTVDGGFEKFQRTLPNRALPELYYGTSVGAPPFLLSSQQPSNNNPFGQRSTFGASNSRNEQSASRPSPFGAPAPNHPFGGPLTSSNISPFANLQSRDSGTQQQPFGSSISFGTSKSNPPFGTAPTPSPFGSVVAPTPSPFGTAQPTPSAPTSFGNTQPVAPFGSNPNPFTSSTTNTQSSSFQSSQPPFGSSQNTFGGFGGIAPVPSPFGTTNSSTSMGQSPFGTANSTSGQFGGGTGQFGSNAPLSSFSSNPAPLFGAAAPNPSPFGGANSTFGSTPFSATSISGSNPAPSPTPFANAPSTSLFGGGLGPSQTPFGGGMSASPFGGGTTVSTTPFGGTAPGPTLFGSGMAPSPSPFGATTNSSTFGGGMAPAPTPFSSGPTPFGTNPKPFGAAPTTSLFGSGGQPSGATSGPSPFGVQAPSTTPFGGVLTTTTFGPTSPFGAASNPSPFGAAAATRPSHFGTAPNPSLSGMAPSPSPFGMAPSPSPFGSVSNPSPFGIAPSPTPFGVAPAPTPFGHAPPTTFGQSTIGGGGASNTLCKFFAQGRCRNGNNCSFSHETNSGGFNPNTPFGGPRR